MTNASTYTQKHKGRDVQNGWDCIGGTYQYTIWKNRGGTIVIKDELNMAAIVLTHPWVAVERYDRVER